MGELERDDVPTPITKVSNAPSTPIVENQPDQVAPSKSDGLLAPASILKKGGSGAETPTTEAPESPSSNAIPILRSPSPSPLVDKGTVYENGTIYENLLPPLPPFANDQRFGERSGADLNDPNTQDAASRKSVQFARLDVPEMPMHTRHESLEGIDFIKAKSGSSFMSKIKAMATGSPLPTPKSAVPSVDFPASPLSAMRPASQRAPSVAEATSDVDADAEETADESNIPGVEQEKKKRKKQKRRLRRYRPGERSAPSTPKRTGHDTELIGRTERFLRRRASMPDTSLRDHAMSEDEARVSGRASTWRRGFGGRAVGDEQPDVENAVIVGRRRGHIRRSTVFGGGTGGGGVSDGDAIVSKRPRLTQASTYGAHKWKQVKNTLKLLRQKKEDRVDYYKSAELMAELRAGAPAVLMLASMIQRDEHGNKRIPVLLEQLKLNIKDSTPDPDDDSDRHWIFTIELEYGSGPSRMSWTVIRTIKDIYNLHFRYKFALRNEKYMSAGLSFGPRLKQPKFPYSAFPYLRGARKQGESSDSDQGSAAGDETNGEGAGGRRLTQEGGNAIMSEAEGFPMTPRRKSRSNLLGMRRRSTGMTEPGDVSNNEGQPLDHATRRQRYIEKQRRILEKYLSEMIRWLMFRADSNRLCRFLELSALGVRLAAEGSYHGKEGYLHIQSSKGLDFRRVLTPAKVISRHSRKWFLVRQSYIVCVESPENMNIYDVYLVDSKFNIVSKRNTLKKTIRDSQKVKVIDLTAEPQLEKHHTLTLQTSERQVRLFSGNQAVMRQFEESINEMLRQTLWFQQKRFDSFAPVRTGAFAQWLVDGRDYMWNVSRAINMAKDVIYIHDWWLSPELYMRRPACISQKWRLDRLLQKKAREGVKVFVIIYRNVEAAIPIDSEYTKFSLLNLHPNIFVQRSPNQFKKNQFFFAHHEKVCVVDHDVGFVGGIDLCFGRWDCPQHPLADDKPTGFEPSELPKDAEHCQLFPGKDYSNPRIQDFVRLHLPYEEMYERSKTPRMPWHDVSMQVVGQPARDLTRHFVQRWNYLRRGRTPTRPLPFLLPPPDAKMEELEALGLTGTCEVQILRSATTWSLGIEQTEHSIQTAYLKMIEDSEHFIYIENQFFITSTEMDGTRIVNRIGDALVERIVRAHQNGEEWRCVIVMPLLPGFQNTVDEQEGTSVRMIMMSQFRSICRGDSSIFGRLRAVDIEPEDYINFYSLRQWGIIGNDTLSTEQLYIHAKTIIVDDRVALIGSANINERSMLGTRDSECAAIVRDTDMISSTMAGKPYLVGRFAHTLRLRLMREHLGLDVDEILEQERQQEMDREAFEKEMDMIYQESDHEAGPSSLEPTQQSAPARLPSFNNALDLESAQAIHEPNSSQSSSSSSSSAAVNEPESDPRVTNNPEHQRDLSGYGKDNWKSAEESGLDAGRDSVVVNGREVLVNNIGPEGKGTLQAPKEPHVASPAPENRSLDHVEPGSELLPPMPPFDRRTTDQLGLPRAVQLPSLPVVDDTDIGGPPAHVDSAGNAVTGVVHPMAADIKLAHIDKDCMRDPVNPTFFEDIWNRCAANNTKLYRRVFRCMPDSEVLTWAEYQEYDDYGRRFYASMDGRPKSKDPDAKSDHSHGPTSAGLGIGAPGPEAIVKVVEEQAAKVAHKVAEKANVGSQDEEKPRIIIPGVETGEMSEKQVASDGPGVERTSTGASLEHKTPAEKLARENETSSPVSSRGGEAPFPPVDNAHAKFLEPEKKRERRTTFSTLEKPSSKDLHNGSPAPVGSVKRRRRATTKGSRRGFTIDDMPTRAEAEELMKLTQGHLVQFPYDWLLTEETNGNWGYQVDGVAPLSIYT
ncbi:unnamed protein product [Clonostachys rosea f. rosea IK726]|uniref:Uncharacterized protein n=1 Tax=Clonostachys rosea f. rosea IK726 TaxID=1349383 RepID=A0ACA9U8U6_BIOOC|nr:unnamed protein product [Clonostachys rosea f. rosea IK726]